MPGRHAARTQDLLRQMSSTVVPVEEPEQTQARRERVVGHLELLHDELGERRQRTQRWTRRAAVLAVAALPLLAVGGYRLAKHEPGSAHSALATTPPLELSVEHGPVLLAHGSADERPVRSAERLAPGDHVHTGRDGRARVRMHSGTSIEVSPVTELSLGAEVAGWRSESVGLDLGRVDVSVPKLPPGAGFSVVTPDTRVEVHGTHFTVIVEPGPDGKLVTRVGVRDGKVLVESQGSRATLVGGAHWSSHKRPDSAKPASTVPPASTPPAAPAQGKPARQKAAPPVKSAGASETPHATAVSSLAQQNRLFQAAMDARRSGDDRRALALLDQLISRYPGSPLEQDARVERFRTLKRLGRGGDATQAARRYLAEHPDGFARDEARQMALDPAPDGSR